MKGVTVFRYGSKAGTLVRLSSADWKVQCAKVDMEGIISGSLRTVTGAPAFALTQHEELRG